MHGFGDRAIFNNVSFRLLAGEHIGLVGANGEGKSTFMNIVTGTLTPDEGKVEWNKHVRVGYLDQHAVLEKGMTIEDVLKSAFSYLFDMEQNINEIYESMADARSPIGATGHLVFPGHRLIQTPAHQRALAPVGRSVFHA